MLHVWLREQHSPLAVWHVETKKWQPVSGWQQLYDTYSKAKNSHKSLCLYFPSSHLLQVDTELSTAQLKQLGNTGKQYLFEETSLTAVEQLAVRQLSQTHTQHLYALAQGDIEIWQQSAALVGMSISALLPDFLLLPVPEEGAGQQVVLYQDQHTALLRQSQHVGVAISYLPLILESLPHLSEVCTLSPIESSDEVSVSSFAGYERGDAVESSGDSNIDLQKPTSDRSEQSQVATETALLLAEQQIVLTTLSTTPVPVENPERHALNFFVKSSDSQLSPYLRMAMMVALSALILQIATDGLQIYRYNTAATATQSAVATQYQAWFTNEVLNTSRTKLQVQMQPKLQSGGAASASHIAVLARISPLIKQSSLHAQALVMEPRLLSFTLIAPDRNSLDQFASTLTSQGIAANLERVNSNEQGQFSGQVTVNVVDDSAASSGLANS